LAAAIVLIALGTGGYVLHRAQVDPSTDDATIDADVVHVAPSVGGRIVRLGVEENSPVKAGDLLLALDPVSYRAGVAQAEAELALARAGLATQQRAIGTQQSTATVAGEQIDRALVNRDLAARNVDRLRPLADKGYVPAQQLDQAQVVLRDAETSLAQAREQSAATRKAVDTPASSVAIVAARQAALVLARKALADTEVRAPHDGRVVGLGVTAGEVVAPSQALFTLIDTSRWFASANFRETALGRIRVGDCATVYALTDRTKPIRGRVDGIGAGVLDAGKIDLPRSVPYVEKALNWVRVEQRFPVRVRLEHPPADLMRVGASAVVEIRRGAACS
jgi:multidrug efflux system membrane fusion protein